jgi:hypothetical protein
MPSATQSSTSSTGSTRFQKTKNDAEDAPSSPPCAQLCTQEDADDSNKGTRSQDPEQEPIEVSDSNDDMVEVVEDDDKELGACSIWIG